MCAFQNFHSIGIVNTCLVSRYCKFGRRTGKENDTVAQNGLNDALQPVHGSISLPEMRYATMPTYTGSGRLPIF